MRIKPVIVSLCAAALAVSSASAKDTQPNNVAKEKQTEQQKKICRWLPVTGSNMNQKVCLTAEEWKKAESLAW